MNRLISLAPSSSLWLVLRLLAVVCLLFGLEGSARADEAAPGSTSDGRSRFVYAAAVAGLVTGGIVAYQRAKKGNAGN